jgi:hypothetical protein
LAFRRVLKKLLSFLHDEAASHLLYQGPFNGDVDDAASLLLVGFLAGTGIVIGLLQ